MKPMTHHERLKRWAETARDNWTCPVSKQDVLDLCDEHAEVLSIKALIPDEAWDGLDSSWDKWKLERVREQLQEALNELTKAKAMQVSREPTPKMCAAGFAVPEAEHDPAGVWRAMWDAKDSND